MIFSENRFTLFGIMLKNKTPSPKRGWAKWFPGFARKGAKN
jgi:hypothetical protein